MKYWSTKQLTVFTIQLIAIIAAVIFSVGNTYAQPFFKEHNCKRSFPGMFKNTVGSIGEDAYDIHHVKMDLKLNNLNTEISGCVTINAKVVVPTMNEFVFELADTMIVDSVVLNGQLLSVNSFYAAMATPDSLGNYHVPKTVRKASMQTALVRNTLFSVKIYYHSTIGYNNKSEAGIFNWNNTTGIESQPYQACLWWPCKQSLTDKIDSMDIWLTVPDSLIAPSNGKLVNTKIITPDFKRYEWKTNYPIEYYLVFVSAVPYQELRFTHHFWDNTDTMNYNAYFPKKAGYDSIVTKNADTLEWLINSFSEYFGRYPFWKEKLGQIFLDGPGPSKGMENQTITRVNSLPYLYLDYMEVHENAHQWFGDYVTCASQKDIWLNEGWATFCEMLPWEKLYPIDTINKWWRTGSYNNCYFFREIGPVYQKDTGGLATISFPPLVYDKGAVCLRMLRYIAPDDETFFECTRNYLNTFKFSTAITEDFKWIFEQGYHRSLDTFFNQWIYNGGYPIYDITYNQKNEKTFIRVKQKNVDTTSSIKNFVMPLELYISSMQGDVTIVKVYNKTVDDVFTIVYDKPIQRILADPNSFILHDQKNFLNQLDTTLQEPPAIEPEVIVVVPNPTKTT